VDDRGQVHDRGVEHAALGHAGGAAAVAVDQVAVVALLDVGLDEAVAALRGLAQGAGVGVDGVAVVSDVARKRG